MSGQRYQTLLECRRRSRILRAHGFTSDQIAVVLSLDHDVSPLRLYRYASGVTATQAVAAVNQLDPSGSASLRESRLYDYEAWPASRRRPPTWLLTLLASIYGTTPGQLRSADAQSIDPPAAESR